MTAEDILLHIKSKADALEATTNGGYELKQLIMTSEVHLLYQLMREILTGEITTDPHKHRRYASHRSTAINTACSGSKQKINF